MGFRLDWHIEANDGWAEIGEDADLVARRKSRQQRLIRILAVALGIALIGGIITGLRLRQAAGQRRANLEALVAAETLALRIGDRAAFLKAQSPESAWKQHQSAVFDDYRRFGASLQTTGEIVEMEIKADQGRVVLRETLRDRAYLVTWFYRHDGSGWHHVPSLPGYWGTQKRISSPSFTVTYYEADQPYADAIAEKLFNLEENLSAAGLPATSTPGLQISIVPDPFVEPGWRGPGGILELRSPQLERLPENRMLDAAWIWQADGYLEDAWLVIVSGPVGVQYRDSWLIASLDSWLMYQLEGQGAQPFLITSLEEVAGPNLVRALLDRMSQGDAPETALAAVVQEAIRANGPSAAQLSGLMRAESTLDQSRWQRGFTFNDLHLFEVFQDPERPHNDWNRLRIMRWSLPATIEVFGVHRSGEMLWAETRFSSSRAETFNRRVIMLIPFRQVNGAWYRSVAQEQDFQSTQFFNGDSITLRSNEIDSLYDEAIMTGLERAHGGALRDFKVDPALPVRASLVYTRERWQESTSAGRWMSATAIEVFLPSPHLPGYVYLADVPLKRQIEGIAADHLLREVLAFIIGDHAQPFIADAIVGWELERLGYDPDLIPYGRSCLWGGNDPANIPLEQLWVNALPVWSETRIADAGELCAQIVAADALLAILVGQGGVQIIPDLIVALHDARNAEEWLMLGVGTTLADIELEWRAELRARLNAAR